MVRAQEDYTVVVDNGDAKPLNGAARVSKRLGQPAQEVPAEYWILCEEDSRRRLDAKRLDGDLVLVGGKPSRHSPETLNPAGLDIQSKHLSVLALEYAMGSTRIQLG